MEVFGLFDSFLPLDWCIFSVLIFPLFMSVILRWVDHRRKKKRAAAEAKARIEELVHQKERPDGSQDARKVSPRYRRQTQHYVGKHERRHHT